MLRQRGLTANPATADRSLKACLSAGALAVAVGVGMNVLPRPEVAFAAVAAVLMIAGGAYWVPAKLVTGEDRQYVIRVTVAAVAARVLGGIAIYLLLRYVGWGYGTASNIGGYMVGNAYARDMRAWGLAQEWVTRGSLFPPSIADTPFRENHPSIVYLGAAIYRILSPSVHLPWLFSSFVGLAGGLAVPFVYLTGHAVGGRRLARVASVLFALQPEIAFWATGQLRDPLITLGYAMGIYGVAVAGKGQANRGLVYALGGSAVALATNANSGMPLLFLVVGWYAFVALRGRGGVVAGPIALLGGLIIVAVFVSSGLWLAAGSAGDDIGFSEYASGQSFLSASVMTSITKFESLRERRGLFASAVGRLGILAAVPVALLWSAYTPLPGSTLFSWDSIVGPVMMFRAVGWHLMLPFMLYGIVMALRPGKNDKVLFLLALVAVLSMGVSALQDWADLWDSARYRSAAGAAYVILAGVGYLKWRDVRPKFLSLLIFASLAGNFMLTILQFLRRIEVSTTVTRWILLTVMLYMAYLRVRRDVPRWLKRRGWLPPPDLP